MWNRAGKVSAKRVAEGANRKESFLELYSYSLARCALLIGALLVSNAHPMDKVKNWIGIDSGGLPAVVAPDDRTWDCDRESSDGITLKPDRSSNNIGVQAAGDFLGSVVASYDAVNGLVVLDWSAGIGEGERVDLPDVYIADTETVILSRDDESIEAHITAQDLGDEARLTLHDCVRSS